MHSQAWQNRRQRLRWIPVNASPYRRIVWRNHRALRQPFEWTEWATLVRRHNYCSFDARCLRAHVLPSAYLCLTLATGGSTRGPHPLPLVLSHSRRWPVDLTTTNRIVPGCDLTKPPKQHNTRIVFFLCMNNALDTGHTRKAASRSLPTGIRPLCPSSV